MRTAWASVRTGAGIMLVILAVMLVAHFGILAAMPTGSCHVGAGPALCVVADAIGDLTIVTTVVFLTVWVTFLMVGTTIASAQLEFVLRMTRRVPLSIRAPSARALTQRTVQRMEPFPCMIARG